ncbi:MAG: glycosyltransferase family 4 protein, partial [Acidobacteria bacterium]|nr:glycosyltransferase family 4 protein [Acidobacteriota bacterium]
MHVLITSDTVGGVWTYTQELVSGLVGAGHQVTLVSFGKLPLPHQTAWIKPLPRLDYRPTEYRLEWMETAERDIEESRRYLELVIGEVKPDVLHFSQYSYGDLDVDLPRIVVAHSDIVSWWVRVHGREPEDTPWIRNYRKTVARGLRAAELVVAPSAWMLDQLAKYYGPPRQELVIYNGRSPHLFDPRREKEDFVLSVGRVWDPAKNLTLWFERAGEARVSVVGWEREPGRQDRMRSLEVPANVTLSGAKSQDELRELFARAAIYAATSRYEPFGLAPLEAALSGCALVLNDNPVFHELWDGRGIFFDENNSQDLARQVDRLRRDSGLRREYAERAYEAAGAEFT